MAIRKRGEAYHYDFAIDGVRFRGSCKTDDRKLALAIETKQKTIALERSKLGKKQSVTINAIAALEWKEKASEYSSSDFVKTQNRLLIKMLGREKTMDSITDTDVGGVVSQLKARKNHSNKPLSNATVNRYISQLRTLNSYAKTKGYAHSDVVFSGHFLKESPSKENVLGTDDLEALLDAEPEYLNNPIEFSILTGLRKGNVRDLQIRQVNFTSATVTMVAKGKKMHSVPLLPRAVEILREAIGDRTEGYVFLNNGLPMGDFKKAWATKKRNAGIPKDFRWHDLRHTFASWCVGNGMPITLAQELLGHKNLSTTMRYAHYGREAATKSLHDTIGRKIVTKRSGANG